MFCFINVFRTLIKALDAFSVLRDASSTKSFMSQDFSEELHSLIDIANAVLENHEIGYGINELAIDPKGLQAYYSKIYKCHSMSLTRTTLMQESHIRICVPRTLPTAT